MRFQEYYKYTLVNLTEFNSYVNTLNPDELIKYLDEETITDLRTDTDLARKRRSAPVGSFFEKVEQDWTVEYKSTSVTTPGVDHWVQYIQPVIKPPINATLEQVRQAFNGDILAHCTCPDFKYRMKYYATVENWNWGNGENRPPNMTNPPPPRFGKLCKHLVNSMGVIKGSTPTILSTYRKNYL